MADAGLDAALEGLGVYRAAFDFAMTVLFAEPVFQNMLANTKNIALPKQLFSMFNGRFRMEKGSEAISKAKQVELGEKLSRAVFKPWHIVINGRDIPVKIFNPNWKYCR